MEAAFERSLLDPSKTLLYLLFFFIHIEHIQVYNHTGVLLLNFPRGRMLDLKIRVQESKGRDTKRRGIGARVLNKPREDCRRSASVGHTTVPSANGGKPQVTWVSRGPYRNV